MSQQREYKYMNLPGYRELTEEEVAAYEASVEKEVVPFLHALELEKEQEAAKVGLLLLD